MKTLCFAVVLLCVLVLRSQSLPKHSKSHKNVAKEHLKLRSNSTIHEGGQKRVFSVILAAFTAFNNIADFMGRCNNVVGWFDNINRFMGSGGTDGADQVSTEYFERIEQQIENLAAQVNDSFNDLLAGQEYTQILISVVEHVDNLAVISSLQEEYLEESKKYTEGSPNSALMQAAREKWFDDVDNRFVDLQNALIVLLENNICEPIMTTYDLFEGYAWKNGEQGTGTLVDLMNFITKIRMFQANGYAVWKSHVYKKWEEDEARRTVELNSVIRRMGEVAECENPSIARAFTKMIDHRGTPAFGRIRWTHTFDNVTYDSNLQRHEDSYYRCLTNLGTPEGAAYGRECTENNNQQQWKLYDDNTLRPKDNPEKCLSLNEPGEGDFEGYGEFSVNDCSSNHNNKKFYFEYLTNQIESEPKIMHTFFKLKVKTEDLSYQNWQGKELCLAYRPVGGYTTPGSFIEWAPYVFSCTCPAPTELNRDWCISDDLVPSFDYGWFVFEPLSE